MTPLTPGGFEFLKKLRETSSKVLARIGFAKPPTTKAAMTRKHTFTAVLHLLAFLAVAGCSVQPTQQAQVNTYQRAAVNTAALVKTAPPPPVFTPPVLANTPAYMAMLTDHGELRLFSDTGTCKTGKRAEFAWGYAGVTPDLGCWSLIDTTVRIVYLDGAVTALPINAFDAVMSDGKRHKP